MGRELVFIHGRSQHAKDASDLKSEWISSFREGLAKSGLELPISESDIRFPYYGETLYGLMKGDSNEELSDVIVKGESYGERERDFIGNVVIELQSKLGITNEQVTELVGDDVVEQGVQNWKWVRKILQAVESKVPYAGATSISSFTRDVYLYLRNPGIQDEIDVGVRAAISKTKQSVVVGHSLGSVVAYRLLRRDGELAGWELPLFVTLGSPLAISMIKKALQPISHPACVDDWINAMDPHDSVALYPLTENRFASDRPIKNKVNVENQTPNRHGISGYLSDPVVASIIHDALTS